MISIEKADNGYIVRVDEEEHTCTMVYQKEFNSVNVALAAVLNLLVQTWEDAEPITVKVDVAGAP